MIETQNLLLIAQVSSVITSVIGVIALLHILRVTHHLENDSFRTIFSSLGFFLIITLTGVISMTLYHLFENINHETLTENSELLWYSFLFLAIVFSWYGSYLAIRFNKSVQKIRKTIQKISKKRLKK